MPPSAASARVRVQRRRSTEAGALRTGMGMMTPRVLHPGGDGSAAGRGSIGLKVTAVTCWGSAARRCGGAGEALLRWNRGDSVRPSLPAPSHLGDCKFILQACFCFVGLSIWIIFLDSTYKCCQVTLGLSLPGFPRMVTPGPPHCGQWRRVALSRLKPRSLCAPHLLSRPIVCQWPWAASVSSLWCVVLL